MIILYGTEAFIVAFYISAPLGFDLFLTCLIFEHLNAAHFCLHFFPMSRASDGPTLSKHPLAPSATVDTPLSQQVGKMDLSRLLSIKTLNVLRLDVYIFCRS